MEVSGQLLCSGCFTASESTSDSHSLGALIGPSAAEFFDKVKNLLISQLSNRWLSHRISAVLIC